MKRPKILIIGNSHTRMISRAVAARQTPSSYDIEICWLATPGKSAFGDTSREDAFNKVRQLASTDLLVLTWIGTAHNVLGLFEHAVPFSLIVTVDGPVQVERPLEIIPLSLMREMLEERVRSEDVITQCIEISRCPVVHMMPPPPKENVKHRPGHETSEQDHAKLKFSPSHSRLALWKLEASVVKEYVTSIGVWNYTQPQGTSDKAGFLAEPFQAPDATHANSNYGELCLKDFEAMLEERNSTAQQEGSLS